MQLSLKWTVDRYSSYEFFIGIAEQQLYEIASVTDVIQLEAGETLFRESDTGDSFYFVEQGEIKLESKGREIKKYVEGDLLGEFALINGSLRFGTATAVEDSVVFSISGHNLRNENLVTPSLALEIYIRIARKVLQHFTQPEQASGEALVAQGESDTVEFKSTLRYNLHSGKREKTIELASIKTIAAFLNSDGGILLIGVTNEGEPIGIEKDGYRSHDWALLHLTNLIKEHLGATFLSDIHAEIESINGRDILRVEVSPATMPAYLRHGDNEYFYVRTGPATTALKVSEVANYIRRRFTA